ncbi:MAG: HDOD domain-containing protein [Butyrivibrio sp.]|nr:HDOD domain-containing protein [Butyrivibrio sp.]
MLATLMPLFDENMKVHSYSVFAQKQNYLRNPTYFGIGRLDGASNVVGFDIVDSIGIETLSGDREVFLEINNISIFSDLDLQTTTPHDKLILLMDPSITPQEQYIERIKVLKGKKYKFAIRNLNVADFESYSNILTLMDYVFLDHHKIVIEKARKYFDIKFPNVKLVAVNIDSQEDFDKLQKSGQYDLYEGDFFRMPILKGEKEVAPLKVNYIELMNVVNIPNYDLDKAADVIERDAALVISLLTMVNKMTVNAGVKTVRHAAAMLGQKEMRKWINTAITKELCADKPNEITRVSMQNAKFAQNLAEAYGLKIFEQELFLMGLFSVIDVILDKPMSEALEMIKLSDDIKNALLKGEGKYAPVLEMINKYEQASWQEVSRLLVLQNLDMEVVYDAYVNSLKWYKDLINEK